MQIHILSSNEIRAADWDAFVYASPQGSPFVLFEYMSIVKKGWKAVIVAEKGQWKAVMPIVESKKWTFTAILQPLFAQYWGICFAPFVGKSVYKNYSLQKKYGMAIVEAVDQFDLFAVNFSPSFDYPLPFHWKNYELKTKYTYQLSLVPSEEELFAQLASPLKRQISKAKRNHLKLAQYDNTLPFIQFIQHNQEKGKVVLGNAKDKLETLKELSQYIIENNQGNLYGIVGEDERILAVGIFLDYQTKTYYLQGDYLPEGKKTGAMSLLMWEAIIRSKASGRALFDFEGSMIIGIESFFRKFGAEAVSYLHIYRNQLPTLVKWIQELR